jgi:acetyl esterase/lipase
VYGMSTALRMWRVASAVMLVGLAASSCGNGASDGAEPIVTSDVSAPAASASVSSVPSPQAPSTIDNSSTSVPATTLPLASPSTLTHVVGDVPYATLSPSQRLDLYMPVGVADPALVVFIHGGGWLTGDKRGELAAAAIELFLGEGYATASVNYRLSGEATFPAQLLDVKAAIRWLRANATVNGYDPSRIAVVGESAGAHLAELLGTTGGEPAFDDGLLGNANTSSDVQAVIDFYGPVDLLATPAQLDANPVCIEQGRALGELDPAIEQLLGSPAAEVPDLAVAANPVTYLTAGRQIPPFLILHGDHDCTVPYQASVTLHTAITDFAGADRSTLVIVPGSGHYLDFDFESQLPTVLEFLAGTIR